MRGSVKWLLIKDLDQDYLVLTEGNLVHVRVYSLCFNHYRLLKTVTSVLICLMHRILSLMLTKIRMLSNIMAVENREDDNEDEFDSEDETPLAQLFAKQKVHTVKKLLK
ncbi:hypothetical protein FQA39_LY07966 [Lamprigera yunnana]|nr:hypothetical protein FQA39_LY07966 [Lamprigera yunnana]